MRKTNTSAAYFASSVTRKTLSTAMTQTAFDFIRIIRRAVIIVTARNETNTQHCDHHNGHQMQYILFVHNVYNLKMCNIALFFFGICTNSWRKGKRSLAILSDRPATTPNILWLETALWCTAPMNIRFALKSRSRSRFVREIEQQNVVCLTKHVAKIQLFRKL